ncbi:MAG: acyl-CoA dehydrogenase C-terminal domain-containing protein, partial [Deltaproteobacteria bacterium]|nr:acyl-CoA dehydrogenase C-terminal domain-containing protein [Deltaproteobacteria bacterium]
ELPEGAQREHYRNLVDFITPIIKAYCSDMGFRVCETAIQCLGGYGFCKDYPLEQYLRDSKIMSLYEGTNGIQSMDLMGRKMRVNEGAPFREFRAEIEKFCSENRSHPVLGERVGAFARVAARLWDASMEMKKRMDSDPLQWASYTYPALQAYGEITMAWRLLDMARVACEATQRGKGNDFYRGKILQASWYVDLTLPHSLATIDCCLRQGREILDMPENAF